MTEEFKNNSYLFGNNSLFIEGLYQQFIKDPSSVDESWRSYFKDFDNESNQLLRSILAKESKSASIFHVSKTASISDEKEASSEPKYTPGVYNLINAYISHGHTEINLDPLSLYNQFPNPILDPTNHNLDSETLYNDVNLYGLFGINKIKIIDLIQKLKDIFSNKIGAEISHLESFEEKNWIIKKLIDVSQIRITNKDKIKAILKTLIEATEFEDFLHTKFPGAKRFSIEGGESVIASIEQIIELAASHSAEEIVIGMAHRGRLNVLTKILSKPYFAMFSEFAGISAIPENLNMPGDVKYHLGASSDREIDGKKIHISLTPNPSHLEMVNSVVLGRVRAKQQYFSNLNDEKTIPKTGSNTNISSIQNDSANNGRKKIIPLLIHGDAALSGQGSVFETLMSSGLEAYTVGGALHIVINNQIGFTTDVKSDRFGRYCTEVAKAISAPILHVNGDDIEAVIAATKIALEYRMEFGKDVFIDIVCYRKYGHNEGDEPMFTQPIMYKKITEKSTPGEIYGKKLISEGIINENDYNDIISNFKSLLNSELEKSTSYKPDVADWFKDIWKDIKPMTSYEEPITGVDKDILLNLGKKISEVPTGFNLNSKIMRQLNSKKQMLESESNIDWSLGEALAYGTLLNQDFSIRITGQDSRRGTFSHRHAVLVDQVNESLYVPLNNLKNDQFKFLEISNSYLSELGALAFEYGYSLNAPNSLVIWEAQFGDFANGAQVIIDQFIASGEAKWLRSSGLVLFLPHGYEGQGPEHSSARLERFLQLCAKDNIQVVNCTTPASFFHALRRQLLRSYRKPLIIMTPKSLLRHKLAVSKLSEFEANTHFKTVLDDVEAVNNARKLILCSGKVYYDLLEKRRELNIKDIAIVRLEQLYPFPCDDILKVIDKYKGAKLIWCQEEHENGGAYLFAKHKLEKLLKASNIQIGELEYIGREESPSTAAGYGKLHSEELRDFINKALD